MVTRTRLALWPDSWGCIFKSLHHEKTHIESVGNFWAAVQELEQQFGSKKKSVPWPKPKPLPEWKG